MLLISKSSLDLFEKMQIFTHREAEARHEILLEDYTKKIQIESRVIGDLSLNHIIPTTLRYQTMLIENVEGLHDIGLKGIYS
jgi:glutamine synthetase